MIEREKEGERGRERANSNHEVCSRDTKGKMKYHKIERGLY